MEEENIPQLSQQICSVMDGMTEEYELIFVDDGSHDGSFAEMEKLAEKNSRIRGLGLSRNFGHQVALLAGLQEARGDRIVVMDADGQHPASLIPALVAKLDEGFDIVNTQRLENKSAGRMKRFSSRIFYRLFNALSDVRIVKASADFRIMNRKALSAFLSMDEANRFTRGMISWMGFRQALVEYSAPERLAGRSKYTFLRMLRFAVDGITAFSSRPLRIGAILGLIVLCLGVLYMIYALVMYFTGQTNPGWTSILIVILILGGMQLLILGIIGEYLARIYQETKQRPHYFISRRTGKEE
jgi:dolichol-phosphate mannosyltransferase